MSQPIIPISKHQALCFAGFLVLYEFLTYIANDMIMPGMIDVVHSFHGPESAVASSLTAYILGGATLQIFIGPLSDYYGRRPLMLCGATFFFILTLLIACSQSMEQFLFARYFQGMGLCFIAVIGYATLQEIFGEMDAVRLIAVLSNVSLLAPLLGPLVGSGIILYFSWRSIFIAIDLFALIALWGLWRYMPETVGTIRTDGVLIPRISLAPKVIAANYMSLFKNPYFMAGSFFDALLNIPCLVWIALSPIIIMTEGHLTLLHYALWQLPIFGACILGNLCLRRLSHFCSIKKLIMIGCLVSSIGLCLSYLLPLFINSHFEWLMPGLTIYGLGLGIATGPLNRWILFVTPTSKGTASAMLSIIVMAGISIGIELSNLIYAHHSNLHLALYCAVCGLLQLTGILILLHKHKNTAEITSS